MMRFILQFLTLTVLVIVSALGYRLLIDEEERYDIFDLLKGRPVTAAIGTDSPIVAQATDGKPLLRAVPLDLNNTGALEKVNRAMSDLTDAVVPSVVSIDTTTEVNVTRVVPADPWGIKLCKPT